MIIAAVENSSQALGGLVGVVLMVGLAVIFVTVIVKLTLKAMNRGKEKNK